MISARSRRRANALCLLQALPQNLVVNKAPGILHRLDQSAFVVTWRWPGLLVLDFRIVQLGDLAVAQRRQQLRSVKAKPPQSGGPKECHAIPQCGGGRIQACRRSERWRVFGRGRTEEVWRCAGRFERAVTMVLLLRDNRDDRGWICPVVARSCSAGQLPRLPDMARPSQIGRS